MKKGGILNAQLAGYIAALGHRDTFMVGDAGMPVPKGVPVVDLALCAGVPSFIQVIDAVADETEIEGYILAEEILEKNTVTLEYMRRTFSEAAETMVSHDNLKELSTAVKFVVRTGEFTPYPNVILQAGVMF